jgi:hypothetical protein
MVVREQEACDPRSKKKSLHHGPRPRCEAESVSIRRSPSFFPGPHLSLVSSLSHLISLSDYSLSRTIPSLGLFPLSSHSRLLSLSSSGNATAGLCATMIFKSLGTGYHLVDADTREPISG